MQSSERAQELERLYETRRGHAPHISINDDSHHITEAIGDMYGDSEYSRRDSRPLSFITSPTGEVFDTRSSHLEGAREPPSKNALARTSSNEQQAQHANASPTLLSPRNATFDKGAMSPPRLHRENSDTANQTFEFQDIDSQSSPAAVAQELSNLQAIRRMSMDVHGSDPDLPSFGGSGSVPAAAPSHTADEDDPSRMFWVPARVHPELAPKEFKTFIEEKVQKHRRRSGDSESLLSPSGLDREGSTGGLRRKKSMLSKQVEGPNGYRDGADRLERQRSQSSQNGSPAHMPSLQQLESLAEDPATIVRRLSLRDCIDPGAEVLAGEDIPILPGKPSGQSLKRSTRTNYRRGSLRKGERVPFSRRMAGRHGEADTDGESPVDSPVSTSPVEVKWKLQRVQTDPTPSRANSLENFSRPARLQSPPPGSDATANDTAQKRPDEEQKVAEGPKPRSYHSRIASNGRTTASLPGYNAPPATPVPQIVETPPPADTPPPIPMQHPERKSSKSAVDHNAPSRVPPQVSRPPPGRQGLVAKAQAAQAVKTPTATLDEMASHPTALPGHTSATRTDSLSIIPTYAEEKKPERGDRKSKDKDDGSEGGIRKTSWGWFSRKDNKDKDEEEDRGRKEGEKEEKEAKKSKSRLTKAADKLHDNTRLDVLQTSIEGRRGRESLVLDRDSIKLDEERQKTSSRKSAAGEKKEKEGIFSTIFGSSKRKGDRDFGVKKASSTRGLSPEPPVRVLRPDIDYNWTRFSILEERAIYRMAHIKLANPRRELYSQVLLSNFMYSYLAKVQQMHPHIQIGQTAAQKQQQRQAHEQKKKQEEQQRQQQQQQPEEFTQYQKYQAQQARSEGHDGASDSTTNQHGDYGSAESGMENGADQRSGSHASQASQHSHASQYSSHRTNGSGYSVASGQSYMGHAGGQSQQTNDYDDEEEEDDEDYDDDDDEERNTMW